MADIILNGVKYNGIEKIEVPSTNGTVQFSEGGGSSELAKDLIERTKTVYDLRESGATSIGLWAFANNDSLENIIFPEGLTSIGGNAFDSCLSLALTSLPEGITSIGENAFCNCPSLALTSLPEGITSIGSGAFAGCASIAITSLPEHLVSIGNGAFYDCTSLAITSLPEGITRIGEETFYLCDSLVESIIFEGNIESIGWAAFDGCTGIMKYSFINNTSVPSNECQFYGINENCKIVVPDALYDTWIVNSDWSSLGAHIIKQSKDV